MTAEGIAKALGGRKAGAGWMARCQAHDDRELSLSIRQGEDGKVLVRCHAGCDQWGVIAALRARGLWEAGEPHGRRFIRQQSNRATNQTPDNKNAERAKAALEIWDTAGPAHGTLVETYLASRGLHVWLPPTLRFHTGLKHPSGGIWPAMMALVTRGIDGTPQAIHRTFLAAAPATAPIRKRKREVEARAL